MPPRGDGFRGVKQFGQSEVDLRRVGRVEAQKGLIAADGGGAIAELFIGEVAEHGEGALVVHDEHRPDPTLAFALSRLAFGPHSPTPIGIFRDVGRPLYEAEVQEQVEEAIAQQGPGDLAELIRSGPTWTVT